MKIKTDKLKTVATIFSGTYDDVDVLCTAEGMEMYARSLDMVSVMLVRIPSSAFSEYAPLPRFEAGVKDLLSALKHMGAETEISMTDDFARLKLSSDGFKTVLPLPPTPEDQRRMPSLNLGCGFMCDLAPVRKVIEASKIPVVRMDLDEARLYVSSLDERQCGPSVEIRVQDLLSADGKGCASYPVEHLGSFLSKFPKGAVASFEFDTNMPASVSFVIDDMEGTYMMAPWVEESRWRPSRDTAG